MSTVIGLIIVTISVFGGFMMASGPMHVLVQPSEWVVVGGASLGMMIGSAPLPVFVRTLKSVPQCFRGSGINRETYRQLLGLLFLIFNVIRKEGVLGIEKDLAEPKSSERFNRYPLIVANHHAMELLIGSLRLFVDGVVNAFDLDKLMEAEIDSHHHESQMVPTLITKVSDALPGLGIVAAVLGIIITMQYLDGSPEEIGHHVAAALVGTFLGLLLSYGYMQPIVASIEIMNHETHTLLTVIRSAVVAFAGGSPPAVAIEFGRKVIGSRERPTDEEVEKIQQDARRS